jgi:hypothetical protein
VLRQSYRRNIHGCPQSVCCLLDVEMQKAISPTEKHISLMAADDIASMLGASKQVLPAHCVHVLACRVMSAFHYEVNLLSHGGNFSAERSNT